MWPQSICWLVVLVVFLVVEGITVGLVSIWFAAGALAALLVSLVTDNIWVQILVFLLMSAVALAALRPLARKYFSPKAHQPTNADRIIGTVGVVTEKIDNLEAKGQVWVNGTTWTARSDNGQPIETDIKVRILRIEGVKVFVQSLESSDGAKPE